MKFNLPYSASLAGVIGFLLVLTSAVSAQSILSYELSMPNPNSHYFYVKLTVEDVQQPYLNMVMPVWTPGSYLVREFSRNVDFFEASGNEGNNLPFEKTSKNIWRVQTEGLSSVSITYQVYAFELTVRTSYLDLDHGYVNGTSVFMYPEGREKFSCHLKIVPYTDWEKVSTSLTKGDEKWEYTAPNYDILVDSPIEIGNHETFEFEAAGVVHEVAMFGETIYDEDRLKTDMAKIVEASTAVFGENPNDRYVFIIHHLDNRGGGLEHLKSTTLQVDRWTYASESSYNGFLSLVAHEYFHLWLVKRIRPEALGPFDYTVENYTDLLWVMEGFTSYYDELLLQRTGILTEDQYIRKLTGSISSVENRPGNEVQPVAMASFDAWIKYYRPDENSINTTVSYYTKGSVLAAMLDLSIINASKGKRSLDTFMQRLYQEYFKKQTRGFTTEEFKSELENLTGSKLDDFFANYVNGTEKVDYNQFFAYAGLELIETPRNDIFLGVGLSSKEGQLMISRVYRDSPAFQAGLNPDDEILALNGFRVNQRKLNELLDYQRPGDKVQLMVSREGLIRNFEVELKTNPFAVINLVTAMDAKPAQKKVYQKWLQLDES